MVDGIDWIKTPYNHVKTAISASKSIFHSFPAVLWSMDQTQKMTFQCISVKFQNDEKSLLVTFSTIFFLPFHLANGRLRCPKKFRLDRKIGFRNTLYTKFINVIIDSIGPSIILWSILPMNIFDNLS